MVKAGHILKCNAARDFTSWSTAAWGQRRLLLAMSTTASNFFPPHPPCIIGMRYADVPGETLVLAKFGSEPKCTCTVKVQENPPSLGWIQRWNGCDWGSRDQGSGFTCWRFRFWSSSQSSRVFFCHIYQIRGGKCKERLVLYSCIFYPCLFHHAWFRFSHAVTLPCLIKLYVWTIVRWSSHYSENLWMFHSVSFSDSQFPKWFTL